MYLINRYMDYKRHYDLLINRAKTRVLDEFSETHHIVPRCLGGSNDPANLVELTPEEHYVAHQLLIRIYPSVRGLTYAAIMMTTGNSKAQRARRSKNKLFGWIKRKQASAARKPMSAETKRKISEANRGRKLGPLSDSTKQKMSLARAGVPKSAETKMKIQASLRGKPKSESHKQALSDALLNRSAINRYE